VTEGEPFLLNISSIQPPIDKISVAKSAKNLNQTLEIDINTC